MTVIAIMRTKDKKEESESLAKEMGFEVRFASPLELSELDTPKFWRFVEEIEAGKVQRVIITSSTAVKYMMKLLNKKDKASVVVRRLNEKGVIAIGPVTADACKQQWIKVEAVPEKFTSDGLVDHLKGRISEGDSVWIIRSDKGSAVLVQGLERMRVKVDEVAVYSLEQSQPDRSLLDMYFWTVNGGIDVYAFTSSMTAESFIKEGEKKYGVKAFGTALNASVIAAIGEPTKRTLEGMGIDVDVMPDKSTFADMLYAIKVYIDKSN